MSPAMRILVVEDEPKLAALVCEGLRGAGLYPDHAPALADARTLAATVSYEAIVLDLALPDGHGLDLLREARRNGASLGVLALTARDSVEDRVAGLEAGADDYLVKPFAMQELIARVRALLRRPGAVLGKLLHTGNIMFDTRTRMVEVAGQPLSLARRELLTLEVLMRRAGRVVSKDVLLDQIYGLEEQPPSNAVPVHVHHLRRALIEAGGEIEIVTFRGIGYMLSEPRRRKR
jgi:DNA-binding response OmpR family regulator